MSELSNDKILEILKSKGKIEAIKYVKDTLKVDLKEAKELVEDIAAKNPDVKAAKPNTLSGIITLGVIIALVWVGCNMCGGDPEPAKPLTRKERMHKLFSDWDGTQPNVVKWIKANIKDPDSFKHIETKFMDNTDKLSVITKFTATNSYGGRVQSTCVAQIDTLGNLLEAELIE